MILGGNVDVVISFGQLPNNPISVFVCNAGGNERFGNRIEDLDRRALNSRFVVGVIIILIDRFNGQIRIVVASSAEIKVNRKS